jgi:hypothetical protein
LTKKIFSVPPFLGGAELRTPLSYIEIEKLKILCALFQCTAFFETRKLPSDSSQRAESGKKQSTKNTGQSTDATPGPKISDLGFSSHEKRDSECPDQEVAYHNTDDES